MRASFANIPSYCCGFGFFSRSVLATTMRRVKLWRIQILANPNRRKLIHQWQFNCRKPPKDLNSGTQKSVRSSRSPATKTFVWMKQREIASSTQARKNRALKSYWQTASLRFPAVSTISNPLYATAQVFRYFLLLYSYLNRQRFYLFPAGVNIVSAAEPGWTNLVDLFYFMMPHAFVSFVSAFWR